MGSGVATFQPGEVSLNVGSATSLTFECAGSAGASTFAAVGGPGAKLTATIATTPGETLTLKVGDQSGNGGHPGSAGGYACGHGGGSTEVWRGSTRLLVAPGGGGAGAPVSGQSSWTLYSGDGGAGGMTAGANGAPAQHVPAGSTGTTVGGGAGATSSVNGTAVHGGGGGPGGGWFDGAAGDQWSIGATSGTSEAGSGGGGGGSGHVDSGATGVTSTDSANTDVGYVTVTGLDQPPAATLVLTEDPTQARIVATLATGAPGAGETAAMSALVEGRRVADQVVEWSRSGDAVALNGDTTFCTPTSGVDYEFRATTFDAVGSSAASGWVGSATGTPDDSSPLLDGGTPAAPKGALL